MSSRYLKLTALLLVGTIAVPLAAQDPDHPADHGQTPPESVEPGFLPPEPAPTDPVTDPLPGDPDSIPTDPAPTDPIPGEPPITDPLPQEDEETFEPIPPIPDPAPPVDEPATDGPLPETATMPPPGTPAEVVERDAEGRATRVRANGVDYSVCVDGQVDGCINPREAGLDFGDVPLDHWPGRPASEIGPSEVGPN